jgi:hypothetical protein
MDSLASLYLSRLETDLSFRLEYLKRPNTVGLSSLSEFPYVRTGLIFQLRTSRKVFYSEFGQLDFKNH